MDLDELVREIRKIDSHKAALERLVKSHTDIILIGNGGSNAIASHIAQDYTKQLQRRALSFSDSSRLTCYINDYGSRHAYKHFISDFAIYSSLIILISSSGNSPNMVEAMWYCNENDLAYIILTGFKENNIMRSLAPTFENKPKLDIWVDSIDYGVVECVHQCFLHSIL